MRFSRVARSPRRGAITAPRSTNLAAEHDHRAVAHDHRAVERDRRAREWDHLAADRDHRAVEHDRRALNDRFASGDCVQRAREANWVTGQRLSERP